MKKAFVILVLIAAVGLGVGYQWDIDILKGLGAISAIGAFLMGLVVVTFWFLRRSA